MNRKIDILHGDITTTILQLMYPILFCGIFQQLYNLADGIVLGHYAGSLGIAVIGGSANTLVNLFVGLCGSLTSGCMIIAAYHYGRNDHDCVRHTIETSLLLSLAFGILIVLICAVSARYYFLYMSVPAEIYERSIAYLRLYAIGFVPYAVFMTTVGLMRSAGEAKRPTQCLIFSYILNILFDIVFVGVFKMQELGIAAAFILTQIISAFYTLNLFAGRSSLDLLHLHFEAEVSTRILKIAVAGGVASLCYSLTNMLIAYGINMLGSDTIAAYSVYNKIEYVFWIFMGGVSLSVTTFCGQQLGAKQYDRLHAGVIKSFWIGLIISAGCSILILSAQNLFPRLFTDNKNVLLITAQMIQVLAPFYCVYTAIEPFSAALRAIGESTAATVISLLFICGVRVAWILAVAYRYLSIQNILLTYPVSWLFASTGMAVYYFIVKKRILHS